MNFFPLNISSIISSSWNNIWFTWRFFIESTSNNMLRMTCVSSALLIILEYWESIYAYSSKIISCNNKCSILVRIDTINISSICSFWKNSLYFPSKFTCCCLPDWGIYQRNLTVLLRTALYHIVKLFCISLIDCSYIFWVSRPINR